jgi:carboxyl-terminal processing protease
MKMLASLAAIALAATASAAAAQPATPAPEARSADPAQRQRLRIFDYVWSEVRDKYYEPTLNGTDWAAVRARYRPQVVGVADEEAFFGLLRAMVGEIRDAHTRVLTPQQVRDRRRMETATTGALLFEVEGEPVVFDVAPGSPAEQAGLRPGMRLLAVGGVPIAEALRRARAEVGPSSSERAALVLTYVRLMSGPASDSLRLALAGPDGRPFEVALPRQIRETAPRFESRRLPTGALYVRFDRFRAPVARLFREALQRNADAPGLIIDLRSNPGGEGREGMRVAAPLLEEPTLIARLATRTGRPPSALLGLVSLPLEMVAGRSGEGLYSGPIVVLTNAATASTSEVIAASLQERGRARIVGSRSCGCALGILRHRRLANGGSLAISEVGLLSGLGRRIEGEGVVPDVPVEVTLRDLAEGRDSVLDRAAALLAR